MKITDAELNRRIAEKCGWIYYDGWHHPDGRDELPFYTTDLNACHEMEGTMTPVGAAEYVATLIGLIHEVDADYFNRITWEHGWEVCHATARQRAIAFALTMGLVTKEEV